MTMENLTINLSTLDILPILREKGFIIKYDENDQSKISSISPGNGIDDEVDYFNCSLVNGDIQFIHFKKELDITEEFIYEKLPDNAAKLTISHGRKIFQAVLSTREDS